jgi:hypothetical protein
MTAGSPPRSPHTARVAATALGTITAAVVPALAGLVLLGSVAARPPVLGQQILTPAGRAAGPAATRQSGRSVRGAGTR